jgi:hypothetical protein
VVPKAQILTRIGALAAAALALAFMAYLNVSSGYLWPIAIAFFVPLAQIGIFAGFVNLGSGGKDQPQIPTRSMTIAYVLFALGATAWGLALFIANPGVGLAHIALAPIALLALSQMLMLAGLWSAMSARRTVTLQ